MRGGEIPKEGNTSGELPEEGKYQRRGIPEEGK